MYEDKTLQSLLDLDGERFVMDEHLGLWAKFEVRKTPKTIERPYGIRYSLTLHNSSNERILGFDNAHAIEYGAKNNVSPKRAFDHWHKNNKDEGIPYQFESAGKLLQDFWHTVAKLIQQMKEEKK